MASLEDFKPWIRPEVPGCPEPLLEQFLKRIIERFCQTTWIWQVDQDLSITEGTKKYSITPPAGTALVNVVSVTTDAGREYRNFVWNPVERKLILQDEPGQDATWEIKIALKPYVALVTWQGETVTWQGSSTTYSADPTYSDFLLDWIEAITYGTLWQLLSLRQQPFFNGELSQIYGQHYFAKESKAKIEANQMRNGSRDLKVKAQPFV